ncbi:restriction endonuclease [Aeromicrobium sp. Root495]|nr:restriction endonuclease [Aeromicrobium sp. Root495]
MHRLSEMAAETGTVTREQLTAFPVADQMWKLVDQSRGIRNPRELEATLTVMSSSDGPYSDAELDGSLYRYDYRSGGDGGDNTKLRRAYELGVPIILLRKIRSKTFVPVFPVYVVGDDRDGKFFLLALDESIRFLANPQHPSEAERRYIARITRQRLHQPEFRGRVMLAYETKCAVCHLKHGRLLDAAHIIGDNEPGGEPVVQNGLALCKIHHAAYDNDLLGISPDYTVHINDDLLQERDGPMLKHGLQEMNGRDLHLPSLRLEQPDRDRLSTRFEKFQDAS